jgi:hypothetical protein
VKQEACRLILLFLVLFLDPEDGGGMIFRTVGLSPKRRYNPQGLLLALNAMTASNPTNASGLLRPTRATNYTHARTEHEGCVDCILASYSEGLGLKFGPGYRLFSLRFLAVFSCCFTQTDTDLKLSHKAFPSTSFPFINL